MMQKRIVQIGSIAVFIGIALVAVYYCIPFGASQQELITDYDEPRDYKDLYDIIEKNHYWLIASENYSIEHALKTKSPNEQDVEYFGKMTIKVARDNGKFAGFVAYYPKNFYMGHLLFIVVADDYRKKGIGKQLMDYALNDLKKMGLSMVFLVTRTTNEKAQALYKKTGFTEAERDDGFVYFVKNL